MVLYNITVNIDEGVKLDWLDWMRKKHVPDVMATGCFIESRISRVHGDEEGGLTFAISYLSQTKEDYDRYLLKYATELQREHMEKYKGKFAAFRTILSVIEEFKL